LHDLRSLRIVISRVSVLCCALAVLFHFMMKRSSLTQQAKVQDG